MLACDLSGQLRLVLVYLRAVGATVGATSTLAPKIGPLGLVSPSVLTYPTIYLTVVSLSPTRGLLSLYPMGISIVQSPKKVGDDIAKATQDWKGLKITVKLTIQNRQAKIDVVPTAASLIIRALKEKNSKSKLKIR